MKKIRFSMLFVVMMLLLATPTFAEQTDEVRSVADDETNEQIGGEQEEVEVEPEQNFEQARSIYIEKNTVLYKDAALSKKVATVLQNTTVDFKVISSTVLQVTIAEHTYYVASSAAVVSDEMINEKEKTIGTVRVKASVKLYANASTKQPLLQLHEATTLQVTGVDGNFFRVNVAGKIAYVAKNTTFVDVSKNLKVLTATQITQNGKKVATLAKNATIKATSKSGNTYTFNKTYQFLTKDVVETTESATWPKKMSATYKLTLTAQTAAGLYNAAGVKVAELPAKTKIELQNITSKYGVVNMLGGTLYVKLSDFKHANLIAGEKALTYAEMNYKLKVLALMYPEFVELEEIGKTVEGRSILAVTLGTGKKQVLFDAAMHAREHMTTNVLMEMVDQYSLNYVNNTKFDGYNVRNVLDSVKITFVPMINADGVTLVQGGKVSTPRATLIKINGGSSNFKRWKANIRGVDLNRQWDYRWYGLQNIKPKWELYKGTKPFSEPEVIALRDYVLSTPFKAYITYHSAGQIMYWEYGNGKGGKAKATSLVRSVANKTGYTMMPNSQTSITAASEPWVSKKLDIPAITMEIARYEGQGPVSTSQWGSVWAKNKSVGLLVANTAKGY